MSQNAFDQISRDLNEAAGMREHAAMERARAAFALSVNEYKPYVMLGCQEPPTTKMERRESEVSAGLQEIHGYSAMQQAQYLPAMMTEVKRLRRALAQIAAGTVPHREGNTTAEDCREFAADVLEAKA